MFVVMKSYNVIDEFAEETNLHISIDKCCGVDVYCSTNRKIPYGLSGSVLPLFGEDNDLNHSIKDCLTYISNSRYRYVSIMHTLKDIKLRQYRYYAPSFIPEETISRFQIYDRFLRFAGFDNLRIPMYGAMAFVLYDKIFIICLRSPDTKIFDELKHAIDEYKIRLRRCVDNSRYSSIRFDDQDFDNPQYDTPADEGFYRTVNNLSEEIKERVSKLRIMGVGEDLIKALFEPERKLSRLIITADLKIYLPDYNIEVRMEPLPKSIFLLFLNHPEGIRFKELSNYRNELTKIYSTVTNRTNLEDIEDSLNNVLDPTKNSINEKCSRIREAFLSQMDESIASAYYIYGTRNHPKCISIDRRCVIIEAKLF